MKKEKPAEEIIWTTEVLKLYEYSCVLCSSKKKVSAKYIEGWSVGDFRRHSLSNGVALCHTCFVKHRSTRKNHSPQRKLFPSTVTKQLYQTVFTACTALSEVLYPTDYKEELLAEIEYLSNNISVKEIYTAYTKIVATQPTKAVPCKSEKQILRYYYIPREYHASLDELVAIRIGKKWVDPRIPKEEAKLKYPAEDWWWQELYFDTEVLKESRTPSTKYKYHTPATATKN